MFIDDRNKEATRHEVTCTRMKFRRKSEELTVFPMLQQVRLYVVVEAVPVAVAGAAADTVEAAEDSGGSGRVAGEPGAVAVVVVGVGVGAAGDKVGGGSGAGPGMC